MDRPGNAERQGAAGLGPASRWAGPAAAVLLALAVLSPYPRLLTGAELPVPDDIFVSDLADGELAVRVEAGRLLRAGEPPIWTPRVYTGAPLWTFDPAALLLFTALPAAMALGWLVACYLVTAALGTYALARHLGAGRAGAFLAGFAFAWSGFFVSQLRHLNELGTVALFPLAVYCLERAAAALRGAEPGAAAAPRRAAGWLLGFAATFGLQLLQSFPQTAYFCALFYGALVAARAVWLARGAPPGAASRRLAPALSLAGGAAGAVLLGALVGMVSLLPLGALGGVSDRAGAAGYEWATAFAYWPSNVLTFFFPYVNGDISNVTYRGKGIFWEDYGYVGLATVLLALGAAWSGRRRFAPAFWAVATMIAYLLVLGRATPLYRLAFAIVPGLDRFRFPTRFLFVVELGLCLLGGLGLTWLSERVARGAPAPRRRRLEAALAGGLALLTAAELVHQNRRQNPFADAARWLAPPRTAQAIRESGQEGRVYTPATIALHRAAFAAARGWSGDLEPYYAHRELLQPDSNLLHGIPALGGYFGLSPRWTVDLIGDHNRLGLVDELTEFTGAHFRVLPGFFDWLEALSVRWLILPRRGAHPRLEHVASAPPAELYRLPGALPRARVVHRGRVVGSMEELRRLTAAGQLDPRIEAVLTGPDAPRALAALPRDPPAGAAAPGAARIVVDRATEVAVETSDATGGLLLLADTFYPGWEATVDGAAAPIYRVNLAHRAVPVGPGAHRVAFSYRPRSVRLGLALTVVGVAALLLGAVALGFPRRRPG
ncbi:YfhO family protein [Anaeromyxobacter paludicola]|uniref:YfhO family protein n=1 Tax=Anaeromyxobacter paludicola TaxID=2918171 RepID=A0ABM7XAZ5_9BACT|nr:YfhO family protein [Anaeromyxobacter paludicola]BDG09038.1 hypothetical protein AMPC_21510 [Anaeromyxobacter paludicola]